MSLRTEQLPLSKEQPSRRRVQDPSDDWCQLPTIASPWLKGYQITFFFTEDPVYPLSLPVDAYVPSPVLEPPPPHHHHLESSRAPIAMHAQSTTTRDHAAAPLRL